MGFPDYDNSSDEELFKASQQIEANYSLETILEPTQSDEELFGCGQEQKMEADYSLEKILESTQSDEELFGLNIFYFSIFYILT